MQRIVIVGGGAGGLVLATQLGKKLGKKGLAEVTLVDAARTHVWKPLLHQLAAGSFDTHAEEIEYLAQARWNHFKFRLGRLVSVDRTAKTLQLEASFDETGREITPAQQLAYDTLIIAVGSQTNDFGTLGAAEHTIKLDSPVAAQNFNNRMINACIRAQTVPRSAGSGRLTVAIVGGGATGVELAAELHASAKVLAHFGFDHIHPEKDLQIVLIEAAPRLLAQLPERLSESALRELRKLAIEVHTNERVVEVTADHLKMASGKVVPASIAVWAAGVKAPEFLKTLGGEAPLETNRLNQLLVNHNLQCAQDPSIFAFGDCAAYQQPDGLWVPPRAQVAYQQAMYLVRALPMLQRGEAVAPFVFKDQGSLVSLSEYSSVGSLMGSLTKGSFFVEGQIAKFMYWALHKQHQMALGGFKKMALITLSELLDRTYRPRIKLH
ncbi:NAD(P)/FAD-dependent oxidoreductase [Rhodoferax aquaticus]|uniref:NAD(P)/FAD-dependent oxidoreductase n=1 Tax=Rhodoferax aquaticus TaxID=2527691 RepID=A0A515EJZ7_9BURK|nr:NAD(P)/FAD-dependent oxidoreductase [Rhodoferax aquaticus]QDL52992.1 NAD(P)/FAD-dependent oxidoreductase [Rhodoferax aquaticus]